MACAKQRFSYPEAPKAFKTQTICTGDTQIFFYRGVFLVFGFGFLFVWCHFPPPSLLQVINTKQTEHIFCQMLQRLKLVALHTVWVCRTKGNCPDFQDS